MDFNQDQRRRWRNCKPVNLGWTNVHNSIERKCFLFPMNNYYFKLWRKKIIFIDWFFNIFSTSISRNMNEQCALRTYELWIFHCLRQNERKKKNTVRYIIYQLVLLCAFVTILRGMKWAKRTYYCLFTDHFVSNFLN